MVFRSFYLGCVVALLFICGVVRAQVSPESVVVVANSADKASVELAKFYLKKRGIPEQNLLLIKTSVKETISWEEFITTMFNPLRQQLVDREWINGVLSGRTDPYGRSEMAPLGHKIGFIVLCRMPLRIERSDALAGLEDSSKVPSAFQTTAASVDSELSLLAAPRTTLAGPLPNPLFNQKPDRFNAYGQVVRVARLDGPGKSAQQMIEAGLEAEKIGLRGIAYIDLCQRHASGDEWLTKAGEQLAKLYYPVITEPSKRIMDWRERADGAAFFFGWWSDKPKGPMLQKEYRYPVGALGWDIYSFSAHTVRSPAVWVPIMIRSGITGTAGNVYEPYLSLVHRPDLFVGGLVDGMSAGEAAYYALPTLSWMCLWVGDPLYQPFKVDLDEQLRQIAASPESPGAQYVVLRQAERLRATSGKSAALSYLEESLKTYSGLALSYEVARLLADELEERRAVRYLAPFEQATAFSVEDIPLAWHTAELLTALRKREEALGVIKVILSSPGLDDDAWMTYVPKAAPLARQFGQNELADQWETKVAEIRAKREEAAQKRAEAARKREEEKARKAQEASQAK